MKSKGYLEVLGTPVVYMRRGVKQKQASDNKDWDYIQLDGTAAKEDSEHPALTIVDVNSPHTAQFAGLFGVASGSTYQSTATDTEYKVTVFDQALAGIRDNGLPLAVVADGWGPKGIYSEEVNYIAHRVMGILTEVAELWENNPDMTEERIQQAIMQRYRVLDEELSSLQGFRSAACIVGSVACRIGEQVHVIHIGQGDSLIARRGKNGLETVIKGIDYNRDIVYDALPQDKEEVVNRDIVYDALPQDKEEVVEPYTIGGEPLPLPRKDALTHRPTWIPDPSKLLMIEIEKNVQPGTEYDLMTDGISDYSDKRCSHTTSEDGRPTSSEQDALGRPCIKVQLVNGAFKDVLTPEAMFTHALAKTNSAEFQDEKAYKGDDATLLQMLMPTEELQTQLSENYFGSLLEALKKNLPADFLNEIVLEDDSQKRARTLLASLVAMSSQLSTATCFDFRYVQLKKFKEMLDELKDFSQIEQFKTLYYKFAKHVCKLHVEFTVRKLKGKAISFLHPVSAFMTELHRAPLTEANFEDYLAANRLIVKVMEKGLCADLRKLNALLEKLNIANLEQTMLNVAKEMLINNFEQLHLSDSLLSVREIIDAMKGGLNWELIINLQSLIRALHSFKDFVDAPESDMRDAKNIVSFVFSRLKQISDKADMCENVLDWVKHYISFKLLAKFEESTGSSLFSGFEHAFKGLQMKSLDQDGDAILAAFSFVIESRDLEPDVYLTKLLKSGVVNSYYLPYIANPMVLNLYGSGKLNSWLRAPNNQSIDMLLGKVSLLLRAVHSRNPIAGEVISVIKVVLREKVSALDIHEELPEQFTQEILSLIDSLSFEFCADTIAKLNNLLTFFEKHANKNPIEILIALADEDFDNPEIKNWFEVLKCEVYEDFKLAEVGVWKLQESSDDNEQALVQKAQMAAEVVVNNILSVNTNALSNGELVKFGELVKQFSRVVLNPSDEVARADLHRHASKLQGASSTLAKVAGAVLIFLGVLAVAAACVIFFAPAIVPSALAAIVTTDAGIGFAVGGGVSVLGGFGSIFAGRQTGMSKAADQFADAAAELPEEQVMREGEDNLEPSA